MNNKVKVSVIIPTYNHGKFIGAAIKSVLDQGINDIEIIIVNNFSSDNTIEVVEGFKDSRIKLINFKNNGIIAASRNIGLKEAKGDYIAFLDSDDIWFKNKLNKQIKILENNQDILLVSGNAKFFPRTLKKNMNTFFRDFRTSFKNMLISNKVVQSTVLMKCEVLDHVGFLDENEKLKFIEDYDYWLRILDYKDKSIYVLKSPLMFYRVHETNSCLSSKISFNRGKNIINKYKDKYKDLLEEVNTIRTYNIEVAELRDVYRQKKISTLKMFLKKNIRFLDKLKIFIYTSIFRILYKFKI